MIEPEKSGSRVGRGRHMRAIVLREDGNLEFIGDTYALGIPLMTNAKIMDAYLCSYQELDPDVVTKLVQEQYDPYKGGKRRYRPTEAENARSMESVKPLLEWREALAHVDSSQTVAA